MHGELKPDEIQPYEAQPDSVPESPDALPQVANLVASGGVAVVPTDTVYGLAARAGHADATDRIFRMKERTRGVNLPVIIGDVSQLGDLGVVMAPIAQALCKAFWPGALTVVFPLPEASHGLPVWLTGRAEVAVRVPDREFLRSLAQQAGPLVVTSANRHGEPTALEASRAVGSLAEPPDVVVDGGSLTATPSTLVNVRDGVVLIERLGVLSADTLQRVLGPDVQVKDAS